MTKQNVTPILTDLEVRIEGGRMVFDVSVPSQCPKCLQALPECICPEVDKFFKRAENVPRR